MRSLEPRVFRRHGAALAGAFALLVLATDQPANATPDSTPDLRNVSGESFTALPHDPYGDLVRTGYRIFTDTPANASRYSGNALSCSNCHLDAGTRANAAPMTAAWGMYPAYSLKVDRVITFQERVQACFVYSLNGFSPSLDAPEMRALEAYAGWLARGSTVGVRTAGRGFVTVTRTGDDPNPLKGERLFAQRCAACHGETGEGRRDGSRQVMPPLWGMSSFNKGAGMSELPLLSGFLKANMPLGAANLSDQEALDVAAWILRQNRWPDPRKGLVRGLLSK